MHEETWSDSPITWCLASALVLLSLTGVLKRRGARDGNRTPRPPPGPTGYPILGTFLSFLRAPAHEVTQEWVKQYGNVVQYKLGNGESVVLGDMNTIKEALITRSPAMDSRCQWRECFIKLFRGLSQLPYSDKWVNTRRRTVSILRDFGMGKSFMESRIHDQNSALMTSLIETSDNGKRSFNPRDMIRRAPMNTIHSIMFGKRQDFHDPKSMHILDTISFLMESLAMTAVVDILPTPLRRLAGSSVKKFYSKLACLTSYMRERVEEHEKTYDENVTRDFVDAWIKAGNADEAISKDAGVSAEDKLQKVYSPVSDVIQDIMVAGAHSTAIAFHWTILLLITHKEEQDLAYKEIIEEIGPNRVISMSDKSKLRRVDAIVHESLRVSTVIPLVAHAASKDTTIGGYDIKAGAEVMYNNWIINRDEKVFPDPNAFKPGRWINEDGKMRKDLMRNFLPFGIGKRSCAGEGLARMELFLSTAAILQHIELLPPDESAPKAFKPEIKHQFGLLSECKPFMMRAKRRPTS